MPKIAITDNEIESCFDVIYELRPKLIKSSFLKTVREMEVQGFKLAYIEENNQVIAVAGYRITTNLFMGKNLYIDDLITSKNIRSKGYGETLITWLRELAIENNCNTIHLDSGVQRERTHKFYFHNGFTIASYHFNEDIA